MSNFHWVTNDTTRFMREYLKPGETVQERVRAIVDHTFNTLVLMWRFKNGGKELPELLASFKEDFYDYVAKGYVSFSSPVWANFGRTGLPVSCNNVFVEDDMESILDKVGEVSYQTKEGAGTSVYLNNLRSRGSPIADRGEADGPLHLFELFQSATSIISQGPIRRGAIAGYIDATHPDIMEWLTARRTGSKITEAFTGVCFHDDFMEKMIAGHKGYRKIWLEVLRSRDETGQPYVWYSDNVNNHLPEAYRRAGRKVYGSNLCAEIALSSTPDESFVCVLSSLNVFAFEEFKDTKVGQYMIFLLDAVTEEYIQKTAGKKYMENSRRFAERQRAVGVGILGLHSAYQRYDWPFASKEAREFNKEVHKWIDQETLKASKTLAKWFGEPEMLKGLGERNLTRMATAPTKSSSFILGSISEGRQPIFSNVHTKDLAKGKYPYYNPILKQRLKEVYNRDNKETWELIENNRGSVANLDFMSDHHKEVFKTMVEINQMELVVQAADAQKYVDQGQSLNLCFELDTAPGKISNILVAGWELGVKGFYYQLAPENPAQRAKRLADGIGVTSVANRNEPDCVACSA